MLCPGAHLLVGLHCLTYRSHPFLPEAAPRPPLSLHQREVRLPLPSAAVATWNSLVCGCFDLRHTWKSASASHNCHRMDPTHPTDFPSWRVRRRVGPGACEARVSLPPGQGLVSLCSSRCHQTVSPCPTGKPQCAPASAPPMLSWVRSPSEQWCAHHPFDKGAHAAEGSGGGSSENREQGYCRIVQLNPEALGS